jgi:hypothetical protein
MWLDSYGEAGPAGRKYPSPLTVGAYDEDVTAHVQSEAPMRAPTGRFVKRRSRCTLEMVVSASSA